MVFGRVIEGMCFVKRVESVCGVSDAGAKGPRFMGPRLSVAIIIA